MADHQKSRTSRWATEGATGYQCLHIVIGQKSKQVYLGFWSLEDKTKATVINKGKVRASAATDTCASLL